MTARVGGGGGLGYLGNAKCADGQTDFIRARVLSNTSYGLGGQERASSLERGGGLHFVQPLHAFIYLLIGSLMLGWIDGLVDRLNSLLVDWLSDWLVTRLLA